MHTYTQHCMFSIRLKITFLLRVFKKERIILSSDICKQCADKTVGFDNSQI